MVPAVKPPPAPVKTGLTLSTRPKQVKNPWTPEEQQLFIEALGKYSAKNMKAISDHIGTRSVTQVRSHLQKHRIKEDKRRVYACVPPPPQPVPQPMPQSVPQPVLQPVPQAKPEAAKPLVEPEPSEPSPKK